MKCRKAMSLLTAGILCISAPLSVQAASYEEELAQLQAMQEANESNLAQTQQNISDLEGKKQELENYLSELSSQYEQLTGGVEELALQAGEKEEELKLVKEQLEQARQDEQKQYEAMKLRMVYMYEKGGSTYLEQLFSCENLADFLNRAEYIQQITDYDRNMLKKYEETKALIAQQEEQIEQEVESINALRTEGSAKQQAVRDLVASTNESIFSYAQQIAANEEEAQVLLAQVAQAEDHVNSLILASQQTQQYQESQEDTSEDAAALENASLYPPDYNPEEDTLESSSSGMNSEVTVETEYPEYQAEQAYSYGQAQEDTYMDEYSESQETEQDIYQDSYSDYQEAEYEEPAQSTEESTGGQGTYLGTFTLTAYCGCAQCCGAAGQPTASGVMPTAGHTVAMAGVPFGTQLLINGMVYTVEDLGTPYGHVDIYFDSHDAALAFGLQSAEVYQLN